MSRELRLVPANWKHPVDYCGHKIPMFDMTFETAVKEWLAELEIEIEKGIIEAVEWLKDNRSPEVSNYRPWKDEEATWYQIWETVSEGTPVSPPFATKEEIITYLTTIGHTRSQAESFIECGWVPSAMAVISENKTSFVCGIDIAEKLKS